MKWKYKYPVFLLFIFFQGVVLAQSTNSWGTFNENPNRLKGKLMGEVYHLSQVANNNFFLLKEWMTGTITLTDGDIITNVKLRYLAYGDEIVVYNENIRTIFSVEKKTVQEFTFNVPQGNGLFKVRKFINLNTMETVGGKSYFEELYTGNAWLLAYHHVDEVKVNPYTDNNGIMRDSEYRLNVTYYFFSPEDGLIKIQRRRSSLLKIYPENKKEIRKILRKNKLTISDEWSFIQAFKLLDEVGILE